MKKSSEQTRRTKWQEIHKEKETQNLYKREREKKKYNLVEESQMGGEKGVCLQKYFPRKQILVDGAAPFGQQLRD